MTEEKLEEAETLMNLIELRERQVNQLYKLESLGVSVGSYKYGEIVKEKEIPDTISDYIISYLRAELSEDLERLKIKFENL